MYFNVYSVIGPGVYASFSVLAASKDKATRLVPGVVTRVEKDRTR